MRYMRQQMDYIQRALEHLKEAIKQYDDAVNVNIVNFPNGESKCLQHLRMAEADADMELAHIKKRCDDREMEILSGSSKVRFFVKDNPKLGTNTCIGFPTRSIYEPYLSDIFFQVMYKFLFHCRPEDICCETSYDILIVRADSNHIIGRMNRNGFTWAKGETIENQRDYGRSRYI